MKIDFDKTLEGYRTARRFKSLLDHCENVETDQETYDLIARLRLQVEAALDMPEYEKYRNSPADAPQEARPRRNFVLESLSSFWRYLAGPSHREMELSRQRRELIERADHAETMAFEALAESAELSRERDSIFKKLKELEAELSSLKHGH